MSNRAFIRTKKTRDGQVLRQNLGQVHRHSSGQATLSFILLVSGLILEIAIAGAFVTYFFSVSALGERLSVRAFTVANSGIRDAQMRVARSNNFTGSFTLQLDSDSATVSVTRATQGTNYIYTVTSTGVAGTRQRKFAATIVADQTSGVVETRSISEQAVQ